RRIGGREPTVPADADETGLDVELEPMLEHEIEIEQTLPPPPKAAPPRVAPVVPKRGGTPAVPSTPAGRPGVGSPPRFPSPKAPAPTLHPPAPEPPKVKPVVPKRPPAPRPPAAPRSEEHTSELQSRGHLVCRLLL